MKKFLKKSCSLLLAVSLILSANVGLAWADDTATVPPQAAPTKLRQTTAKAKTDKIRLPKTAKTAQAARMPTTAAAAKTVKTAKIKTLRKSLFPVP